MQRHYVLEQDPQYDQMDRPAMQHTRNSGYGIILKQRFARIELCKLKHQSNLGVPTELRRVIAVGIYMSSHTGICASGSRMFRGIRTLKKKNVKKVPTILRAMKKS
jgi:hypothetical protein